MATYALGDVHGCARTLDRLLERLPLDARADRLWLVGDLVGHGPEPVAVLRRLLELEDELGDRLVVVLGNHDLRLLAARAGASVGPGARRLLATVELDDRGGTLLDWLSRRPLLHREQDLLLVHAGLHPAWTQEEACDRAAEVAALLAGDGATALLRAYVQEPESAAAPRPLVSARVMTTVRLLRPDGSPCPHKGSPETAPAGCSPWYAAPDRGSAGVTVIFGHWAALGLRLGAGWVALDSGCAWGGPLSAVRVEDRRVFQVPRRD